MTTTPIPTTYAPEVVADFCRQMTQLFDQAPGGGGMPFRHSGRFKPVGPPESMNLGEIADNFRSYLDRIGEIATEAAVVRGERDQLLSDIRAMGRLFERAGLR